MRAVKRGSEKQNPVLGASLANSKISSNHLLLVLVSHVQNRNIKNTCSALFAGKSSLLWLYWRRPLPFPPYFIHFIARLLLLNASVSSYLLSPRSAWEPQDSRSVAHSKLNILTLILKRLFILLWPMQDTYYVVLTSLFKYFNILFKNR